MATITGLSRMKAGGCSSPDALEYFMPLGYADLDKCNWGNL